MKGQAITFDFHNTLAECPQWFELEVRRLPSAFLRWWSSATSISVSEDMTKEADIVYRQLRLDIIEHGNEMTAESCLETVFASMQLDVPKQEIETGVELLMRRALLEVSPIPGAVETVRAIHEAGVAIGVVSSAVYHPFLDWTLEKFGIRGAMTAVITSASAGFYKSRPEIYEIAASEIGVETSRVIHVGDSLRFDVGGASRAGMGTVWLQHRAAKDEESSFVPDLTLQTLEQSAPAILSMLELRVNGGIPSRA